MIMTLAEYSYWTALGTLFLQLGVVYLCVEYFFLKEAYVFPYIARFAPTIVFVVSGVSLVLTLVYSEFFGLIPCGLCWIQRGLLFSLCIICAIGAWRNWRGEREMSIAEYGMGLSVVGALIGLYQHYVQMGGSELVTCPTAGAGADCAQRLVFEFGYITFPLMSATTFLFFIIIFLIYRKGGRVSTTL